MYKSLLRPQYVLPGRKKEVVTSNEGVRVIKIYPKMTDNDDIFLSEIRDIEERMKKKKFRKTRNLNEIKTPEGKRRRVPMKMRVTSLNRKRFTPSRKKRPNPMIDTSTSTIEVNAVPRSGKSSENLKGGKKKKKKKDFDDYFFRLDQQQPLRLQYDPTVMAGPDLGGGKHSPTASLIRLNKTLKDYEMMVRACNRAGKQRLEALCHYKAAGMYEEKGNKYLPLAAKHFERFLSICAELRDQLGECLALNRLGVLHYLQGKFEKSLECHTRHWEISDTQNKIVAHINMGLIFQKTLSFSRTDVEEVDTKKNDLKGMFLELSEEELLENAIEHFSLAKKYAEEISDSHGQSIALLNLGMLEKTRKGGDLKKATTMITKHLGISKKNKKTKTDAYQKLGVISLKKGDDRNAIEMFNKARKIAKLENDQRKSNRLKCYLGIIKGKKEFENAVKAGQLFRSDE